MSRSHTVGGALLVAALGAAFVLGRSMSEDAVYLDPLWTDHDVPAGEGR